MRVKGRYTKGPGIKLNLYTKGGEFADPTYNLANVYTGPYHTVHGVPYKGEKPVGRKGNVYPVKLIPFTNSNKKFTYNSLKRRDYAKDWPGIVSTGPTINQSDENRGWFMMYLSQYLPSGEFMEIDEEQHKLILEKKSPHTKLYSTVFLKWRIRGYLFDKYKKNAIDKFGIVDTNRRSIGIAEGTLPGLSKFLVDLVMYAQPDEEENLTSDGTQLVDEFGEQYEGRYHVHKDFGAMIGKTHDGITHGRLYPITDFIQPVSEERRILQTPQNKYNAIKG